MTVNSEGTRCAPEQERRTKMVKFKPQFTRLIYIDRMLSEGTRIGRYPNCRTLAEEYEVSGRTIQRDIEYMKWQLGAPIEYDQMKHGFYYSEPTYRLPALNISRNDLFAVCIAEKVLQQYEGTPLYDRLAAVFDKLQQSLPDNVTVDPTWLDERFSFFPEAAPTLDPAIWQHCFEALRRNLTMEFDYLIPGYPEAHRRRVDPYHAVGYQAQWYLVGKCHYKESVRVFAISRMTNALMTDDYFFVPEDFDFKQYAGEHFGIFRSDDEFDVAVRFGPQAAPYVLEREWHPSQAVEKRADGSIELSFRVSHLFEVKRWVLSWGPDVRVLKPAELVEIVRSDLAAAAKMYVE